MRSRDGEGGSLNPDRLEQHLGSGDVTLIDRALNDLGDAATNPDKIDRVIPAALPLLSHENAYIQQRAVTTIDTLATEQPELVERHVPALVERFEEESDHASDIVEILAQVIDRRAFDLDSRTIDSLTSLLDETYDTETRKSICRLMGNGINLRAARKLQETYEVDPQLREVVETELSQMADRAATAIRESKWDEVEEAAEVLRFLSKSHPETIEGRSEALTTAVSDPGSSTGDILISYMRRNGAELPEIRHILQELSSSLLEEDISWTEDAKDVLVFIARRYPDEFEGFVDEFSDAIGNRVHPVGDILITYAEQFDSARPQIRLIADRAAEVILEDKRASFDEASTILKQLASSHPTVLKEHIGPLLEMVESHESVVRPIVRTYAKSAPTATTGMEESLLAMVRTEISDSEKARPRAEAALRLLNDIGIPGAEVDLLVERYGGYLHEPGQRRGHALEQLSIIAEKHPDAILDVIDELARILDADETGPKDQVRHVLTKSFRMTRGDRLQDASLVARNLEGESAVLWLGRRLDMLRYRDDESREVWEPVETGAIGSGILRDLRRRVEAGRSVPVMLPRFAPKGIMTISVELLLGDADCQNKIAIYSPGTTNHWGLKSDLKAEYLRYGLAPGPGSDQDVIPLPEVIPSARITDKGDIATYTDGQGPGRLIYTKELEELLSLETNTLDAVILNLTARTKAEYQEEIDTVRKQFDAPIVSVYSSYTKHEGDGYPRYGPPTGLEDADALPDSRILDDPSIATGGVTRSTAPQPLYCDWAFQRWTSERTIDIVGVDSGELGEIFDRVYSISGQLRDAGLDRPAAKIFNVQFTFERLPVPSNSFDNRITERQLEGERFLPWKTEKYIDNLQEYAGRVEDLRVPDMVFQATERLREIREGLAEQNPLYDQLKATIDEARAEGANVTVLTYKKSWTDIIEAALRGDADIHEPLLEDGSVRVVGPDEARGLPRAGWVLIAGPLPSMYGGFYLLPAADRTIVLTYDGSWDRLVERHTADFVDRMNDSIAGHGVRPLMQPRIDLDWEPLEPTETAQAEPEVLDSAQDVDGESGTTVTSDPGRRRKDELEMLAEAFESSVEGEFQEDNDRYGDDSYRTFEVTTTEGNNLSLDNQGSYLRRRPDGSHHWIPPGALSAGDTIAIIDPDVESDLWREHLQELYSEEVAGADATEGVRTWYEALTEVAESHAAELGTSPDATSNLDAIAETVRAEGMDRAPATIKNWFSSVLVAEDALDLARDSSLRIGPRRTSDVRAVGEAFDQVEIAEDAEEIQASMRAVRRLNRSEGLALHEELLDKVDADDANRVKAATIHHEIASIVETGDEEDE